MLSAVPADAQSRPEGQGALAVSFSTKNDHSPPCPLDKSPWPLWGPALPVATMVLELSDAGGESLALALVRRCCWEEA